MTINLPTYEDTLRERAKVKDAFDLVPKYLVSEAIGLRNEKDALNLKHEYEYANWKRKADVDEKKIEDKLKEILDQVRFVGEQHGIEKYHLNRLVGLFDELVDKERGAGI